MKRKWISVLTAVIAAILITTTVLAGKISMSGSALLGSLIWDGYATGLGKTDWKIEMVADGHSAVICTNYGSNDVPGQSSPKVTGNATQDIPESKLEKNGRADVYLIAKPDIELNPIISWQEGGCPNPNWTAKVYFVYWDSLTIKAKDPITGEVVAEFPYTCTTTYTPKNDGYTFDDGTISCSLIK